MGDQGVNLDELLEKVDVNLSTVLSQQVVTALEHKRNRKNMAAVKKILSSEAVASILSADSKKDVASIDVDVVEYVVKGKKDAAGSSQVTSQVNLRNKQQPAVSKIGVQAGKHSSEEVGIPPGAEEPLPKKQKIEEKGGTMFDSSDSSDDDVDDEEIENVVGKPQPDPNVILPQSNADGRRVYGVKGSSNDVVKQGSFLLYDVNNAKKIYIFNDALIKKAVKVTMERHDVVHMAQLTESPSKLIEGAVTFVHEILSEEAKDCPQPTFLNRPIATLSDSDLTQVFSEAPEPIRSGLHKYCKQCGAFKSMSHGDLAEALTEVIARLKPEVVALRLDLPAPLVRDNFVHITFLPIG